MEELTAIAQRLELDAQAARIKKLLLYATAGHWESDPEQLRIAAIQPMLSQLRQLYPTQQQLRFYLHTIAANLTKPIEYQHLADAILRHCLPLYPAMAEEEDEPTAFFTSKPASQRAVVDTTLCQQQQQIAQALELRLERERIVKLLLCLTRDQWESDVDKLAQVSLRELIDEVWRMFPSLDDLERSLFSIVQRLSKAVEYSVVATAMVQQLAPLYLNSTQTESPVVMTALPLVQSIDGFDLRLELMKFTNPLRAKMLLFSLMQQQPFDSSEQSWSALKRYSLEMLLKTMLERYPAAAIAAKLQAVAAQLPQSEDYEQTIDVLLRSLKLPAAVSAQSSPAAIEEAEENTGILLSPVIVKS
jgi:hypothetical protein